MFVSMLERLRAVLEDGCHCRVLRQNDYRKVTHGLLYTKVNCLVGLHPVNTHHAIEKPAYLASQSNFYLSALANSVVLFISENL